MYVQYSDIQDARTEWNNNHLDSGTSEEVDEFNNPYFGFPQMVRFAFNPNGK